MEPLELALEAYGGQERWHEVGSLDVPVSLAGSIRIARKRATLGKNIERMTTKENIHSSARSDKSRGHNLGLRHPNRFRRARPSRDDQVSRRASSRDFLSLTRNI